MAKFRFSLEVLLKHREDIEQKERDALFRIRYDYQLALQQRELLDQKRRQTMIELAHNQSENIQLPEMEWYNRYLNRLNHEIEECRKRLSKLESDIQEQTKIVVESSKKRKMLSALKKKQEREFILSMDKKEQREVEEWVTTKYATGSNF